MVFISYNKNGGILNVRCQQKGILYCDVSDDIINIIMFRDDSCFVIFIGKKR